MSRIKNKIAIILGIIIILLGIGITTSSAYNVGDTVVWTYDNYIANGNLYCMQHGQRLWSEGRVYRVISVIDIEGNVSKDQTGKTVKSKKNAIMLGIVSSNNSTYNKRNAMWNFIYDWIKNVGLKHRGLYTGYAYKSSNGYSPVNQEAEDFADKINKEETIKDETNIDKIKTSQVKYKNQNYTKVGPFKWNFTEKLQEIEVYGTVNGKKDREVSDVKFARYKGKELKVLSPEEIKSGQNVYVLIPTDSKAEKITSIKLKTKEYVKTAQLVFFQSTDYSWQNLMLASPNTEEKPIELDIPNLDIPLYGDLKVIKVDAEDQSIKLSNVGFIIQREDDKTYIHQDSKGNISYKKNRADATEFVTVNGEKTIKNLRVGNYAVYETKNPNPNYQMTEEAFKVEVVANKTSKPVEIVIPNSQTPYGDLKVIKVDAEDQSIKLSGVGFIIQKKDDSTYVKQDAQGNITYTANRAEATEFITENGEKLVQNLTPARYLVYETKNPNYGYEVEEGPYEVEVVANKTSEPVELVIPNMQTYIRLSGYVWLDLKSPIKDTTEDINELYKDDYEDTEDRLMEGVTVRLKIGDTVLQQTKTDSNGAYLFENVEVKLLDSYYVEFEYDGLSYENVTPKLDRDNGSKAIEGTDNRKAFNNEFASIEGNRLNSTSDTITTGVSKDTAGNVTNNLSYNKYYGNAGDNSYTSKFINDGSFIITANTSKAGLNLKALRVEDANEIKNINLGLKERAKSNLTIFKDLANARVTINGYEHTYNYEQAYKLKEDEEYSGEGFNVGVRFSTSTTNSAYTRAIYSSDVNYNQENADDRELKVYITYKIGLKNNANLDARINSILEYYDARYELVKAGATMNENGDISEELTPAEANRAMDSGVSQYKKAIITTNKDVKAGTTEVIYVQFRLNRDAVLSILDTNGDGTINENDSENTNNLLNNFTEINSYTIFKDGELYAAIDQNSNPGNSIPGEETTIEYDTDRAPALRLVVADARTMQGKVFYDETSGELLTDQIREGNGQLDENEKGISGVKLTLTETSGTGLVYDNVTTGEDGTFTISNFIPGKYTLTYTWGDNTYTVQDYKGTIYKDQSRSQNQEWFKTLDPRLSDAMDDWEIRKRIDEETANKVTNRTITTMNSTTPTMSLGIEYEALYTASMGDKYEYKVQNIDFGIVERARQQLALDKYVKAVKIVSQGGETLIDGVLDENGVFQGQVEGLTGGPTLGFVKVEMDKELLQGSTAYITYEMKIKNQSEKDYYTEDGYYYLYGYDQAVSANKLGEVVRIKVGELNDYLDNTLIYNEANGVWEISAQDDENGKTILVTREFLNQELQPNQEVSVELPTSKLLSNEEELVFNNEARVMETTPIPYGRESNNPEDSSEEVTLTTNTGGNRDYVLPITIGISTLIILGAGIVFIKKKVLKS